MEVRYTKPFEKDLKLLSDKQIVLKTAEIISEIIAIDKIQNLKGIKQLKGH